MTAGMPLQRGHCSRARRDESGPRRPLLGRRPLLAKPSELGVPECREHRDSELPQPSAARARPTRIRWFGLVWFITGPDPATVTTLSQAASLWPLLRT